MTNSSLDFTNVLPAVEVYAGVGNPYQTSLANYQKNIKSQADLNNKHGGSIFSKRPKRSRRRERKRVHWGGVSSNTDSRPTELVVPQAPTGGMQPQGPTTGNTISTGANKTLLASFVNSQFDNEVVVPPIPPPPPSTQNGGSLIKRLERLVESNKKTRKRYKKRKGKRKRTNRRKLSKKK